MCSIVGSYNKETFKDLVKLNSHRGSFSYSITYIPLNGNAKIMIKDFGIMDFSRLDECEEPGYYLGHCQAPTNGLISDANRIHPYSFKPENSDYPLYLMHNGIIKPEYVKHINSVLNTKYMWDTQAFAEYINHTGIKTALDTVEGSFACVLFNHVGEWLNVFRNMIAPLYVDDKLNISSTKINNMQPLPYNKMYHIDLIEKNIIEKYTFNNMHTPFYIPN